ncbi:hypothetical protein GBAR_LOCUS1520 [Geodia barretti]|uniref:Major facilitator superfamily (MFS) profile domain-containing protein n=1 Tax=Geodia barretti TaxID=519541 RepID=A0AA35W330_GEOBA|nr:hypothetical protein GBAR_LOCUS1520 [Geodia barretti]
MVFILLFQLLVTSSYSLAIPSLYKFVTTPTELPDELVCSEGGKFWPGLGGSDSDYAWVVMSYSLFGMVAAPVAGMLLHRLPFTITMISFSILLVTGGMVYALASINSAMAEFDISPYHWPGWLLAALTATVASISLIGFVETRSMPRAKAFCPSVACLKMETKLRSRVKKTSCTSYLFLVGCSFLIGASYTIFTSLITPVLSDQFGFSIKYTSYFFVVVSTAYFGSSILQ